MSVSWFVLPFDPAHSDMVAWLHQAGIEGPSVGGRYPTMPEVRAVLATFNPLPVLVEQQTDDRWTVILGDASAPSYTRMLGSMTENQLFEFHFWGSWCDEATMVEILRRFTMTCGRWSGVML